jgi:pentatricopeptide repeat protein
MFCPRQLFRTLNRCRPRCRPRWLSTVQHDSSNVLQQQPTHTIQHDSSDIMQQPAHSKKTLQIMAAANVGNFPTCFRIAAKMKASGLTPDISTYNALMSAAAQDGNAILSWAIFDDMLLIGIRPTISTFTHLIDVIMTPFHFQVSPLTGISRRNVELPLDICGLHWK